MQTFSEDYKDQVFSHWFENGRIVNFSLMEKLPEYVDGRKPSEDTIRNWVGQLHWDERANALSGQISRALDNTIIGRRVEMYKKHAEIGQDMVEMGMNFLKENGIKSDQSALRAVVEGVEIQRQSLGLAEALQKIYTMDDNQLTKELQKLLGKPPMDDSDVTVIPEEIE